MKAGEAVREILQKKGIGVNQFARDLEKKPNLVCERLKQENISIGKLDEMLSALGYKIVITPKETEIKDGEFEIE